MAAEAALERLTSQGMASEDSIDNSPDSSAEDWIATSVAGGPTCSVSWFSDLCPILALLAGFQSSQWPDENLPQSFQDQILSNQVV